MDDTGNRTLTGPRMEHPPECNTRFVSRRNPKGIWKPILVTQSVMCGAVEGTNVWLVCPWCRQEEYLTGTPTDEELVAELRRCIDSNMLAHQACWLAHDVRVNAKSFQ